MVFGLTFPLANNVGDETNNVGEEIVLVLYYQKLVLSELVLADCIIRNPELVFSS